MFVQACKKAISSKLGERIRNRFSAERPLIGSSVITVISRGSLMMLPQREMCAAGSVHGRLKNCMMMFMLRSLHLMCAPFVICNECWN